MSEFSLRRKKQPAPAPATPSTPVAGDALPQPPSLPFVPGNIVLSDHERKDLKVLGYEPGDPLPGNLAQLITAAREEAAAELNKELAKTSKKRPTFKAPREIPLDQLPPERLATLRKAVETAKKEVDYAELHREEMAAMRTLDPSLQRAILTAQGADFGGVTALKAEEDNSNEAPEFELTPSRATPKAVKQSAQPTAPEPHVQAPDNPAACPHCNWKLNQPDPTEPTAGDLLTYVSAWGEQPFVKCYEFFGGRLRVTLRDPTVLHSELVFTQLSRDTKGGQLVSVDDFWRRLNDYRLVVSLESVYVNGKTLRISPEVDRAIAAEPPQTQEVYDDNGIACRVVSGDTVLPYALKTLMETQPLCSETVWRLCLNACQRFSNLVKKIEARAEDPDFLRAIGG